MEGEQQAVSTETAPVQQAQVDTQAQPVVVERPKPTLESTFAGVDWGTIPEETRQKLQEEVDRRIDVARKNAAHRAKKETEAFYKGRESVRPAGAEPERRQEVVEDKPPVRGDFDSYESFSVALAEYHGDKAGAKALDKRERETAAKAEREAAIKAATDFQGKIRAKFPDLEERIAASGDAPIFKDVQDAIQESAFGPEILNEIAGKEGEFDRLHKLGRIAGLKEIAKLEARFEAAAKPKEEEPKKVEVKPSSAPKPIVPVGGKAVSGDAEPSHDKPEEWAKWRNRQVQARKNGTRASA